MDLNELWRNILGELQVTVSKANFETWFKNTFIYERKKEVFTIGVPSIFIEDWLKKKYLKDLQKTIQNQTGESNPVIKFKTAVPKPEQLIVFEKNKLM